MIKYIMVGALLIIGQSMMAQELRFTFQMGAAIPLGEFALNESCPDSGGFASAGINIQLLGERIYKNNFVVGMNMGYSVFGMDQEGIKNAINPSNPSSVFVETQSFQNLNLQARGGYNVQIIEDHLSVTPYIDAGLGVFNSAYYAIQDENGRGLYREGGSAMAFLFTPGIDILVNVNEFVSFKAFGSYQFASYSVDEKFIISDQEISTYYNTVNYKYNSLSVGLGAVFQIAVE